MKIPRVSRLTVLLALAGLTLLVAAWPEAPDDATPAAAQKRPRGAHGSVAASAQPTRAAPASGPRSLGAGNLLGGAAVAATAADAPSKSPVSPAQNAPPSDRAGALAALDTTLVAQRAGLANARANAPANAFAAKSWFVAPPAPPPQPEAPPPPPPPPQAPPLPFKYMGSLQESAERTVWYLRQGERLIVAGVGDVIDSTYRTEGVEAGQLRFTYLPLNQRQTLSIGVAP